MAILQANRLHKQFGGLKAVDDVSFEVSEGQIVGLIGPNGAGKTTLFNLITGFLRATNGAAVFDGVEVTSLLPHQICRLGLVRTFQHAQPFRHMSVFDNVLVAAFFRHADRREASSLAEVILDQVGMLDRKDRLAADITIGETKRLGIARALATEPRMILLDEAMAGLTPVELDDVAALIEKLRESQNITFLLIEHVMRAIMRLSDRVVVLHHGQKIAEGTPEQVANDERVMEAYLGGEVISA